MATQITNYQCPACTGPLQFSATTGKLECEYCGSSYDVAEMEARYNQKSAEEPQIPCPACGADLGTDLSQAEISCPNCGVEFEKDAIRTYAARLAEQKPDSGFLAPHSAQNLPVFTAPQAQVQPPAGAAGAARAAGAWAACC